MIRLEKEKRKHKRINSLVSLSGGGSIQNVYLKEGKQYHDEHIIITFAQGGNVCLFKTWWHGLKKNLLYSGVSESHIIIIVRGTFFFF